MMRCVRLGLAAAMALTALIAATTAFAAPKDASSTDTPPLVAAAHAPCTVTASRFIGEGALADKTQVKSYEVACQEGLGYVIIAKLKPAGTPIFFDCLTASRPGPDGKPSPTACKLPANANPSAGLQPLVDKTGHSCPVDKARAIGSSPEKNYYELACKDGQGVVLITPVTVGGPAPTAENCLALGDGGGDLKCTLTTHEQQLAVVDQLAAASGRACTAKGRRFVGTMTSGDTYYEVACADGKGYMLAADSSGKLNQTVDCINATGIGGGCTLTDIRQAQTEESALYSRLAKKAGFDCQVSKYGVFPAKDASTEVVELQCANRPDGGVGIFPASGAPLVYDCLRAQNQGYRCSMSNEEALYPKLSAQLRAKNKPSCVVSGARPFGRTSTTDLIEVACADGGPGWVLEYPTASTEPSTLLNCAQAAAGGGGGCQLPTNRKS
jgi:hypothetical protein